MQKSPEDLSGTFYLQYSFLQRKSQNNVQNTKTKRQSLTIAEATCCNGARIGVTGLRVCFYSLRKTTSSSYTEV